MNPFDIPFKTEKIATKPEKQDLSIPKWSVDPGKVPEVPVPPQKEPERFSTRMEEERAKLEDAEHKVTIRVVGKGSKSGVYEFPYDSSQNLRHYLMIAKIFNLAVKNAMYEVSTSVRRRTTFVPSPDSEFMICDGKMGPQTHLQRSSLSNDQVYRKVQGMGGGAREVVISLGNTDEEEKTSRLDGVEQF